jgi:hypothetical protein
MTPKEKAEQLLNRFWFDTTLDELEQAKDCALIAVDEMLNGISETWEVGSYDFESTNDFWQSVKKQIEKL